ncbi:MAG: hypothetical protein ABSB60_00895 [Terracidiphilus sp.]|jgi:hypothetical protein
MNEDDRDRMKKLLQQALPPVDMDAEPTRDLWPAMLRRMDEEALAHPQAGINWAWFDGVLAVGLVLLIGSFPAAIPVILYYL